MPPLYVKKLGKKTLCCKDVYKTFGFNEKLIKGLNASTHHNVQNYSE